MALRDQPYIPLYVQDWLTDEKLRECSAGSVGIYSFIVCVMHKSENYGTILLRQKDKQKPSKCFNFAFKLSRHLPYVTGEIHDAIVELTDEGVLHIEGDKLVQRRMVRDNALSIIRSDAAKSKSKNKDFVPAKPQANTEYESEDEYVTENGSKVRIKKWFIDAFWDLYDKKVAKGKAEKLWNKLSVDDQAAALDYIPKYKDAQPDKQFRKNPDVFLRNRSWEDELISRVPVKEQSKVGKAAEDTQVVIDNLHKKYDDENTTE